jgi:hypothetical protein
MKKLFLAIILLFIFIQKPLAQTKAGPVEQRMADSLCNAVNRLDISKVTTKQEAINAYTQCVGSYVDILQDLATEKKADMSNTDEMQKVGVDLAKDLNVMKCSNFIKLETIMAKNANSDVTASTTSGIFKRIDTKGFNYIVISEANGSEKSFLWFRQFHNSERFISDAAELTGKKLEITWKEVEVYLPQAKGYYNLKEITGIEVL